MLFSSVDPEAVQELRSEEGNHRGAYVWTQSF